MACVRHDLAQRDQNLAKKTPPLMHVARLMPKKTPATCVVLVLARLPGPGVSAVLRASAGPHTRNSPVHAIPGLQVLVQVKGGISFPWGVYPFYRSFPPRIAAMASAGRSAPACKAASRNSQWLIFGSLSRFWGRGISFLSSQRPPTSAKWPFLDSYVMGIMSAAWRCARGRLKPTRSPPAAPEAKIWIRATDA